MPDRKISLDKLFAIISGLGVLFVLTEAILQSRGSSICATAGCKVISASARFGDFSILLIGFTVFSLLAVLSLLNISGKRPAAGPVIDLVLVVSLAGEGFFTGYQAFRLFTPCIFCLAVFGFLVVLALLRLVAGKREVIAGFASLVAVFSLFYLVLPAQNISPVPDHREFVLFYSKDCKYCAEVMNKLEGLGLPALHVPVTDYSGLLKSIGIEHVPTLLVNRGEEKIFLTGKEVIERYLSSPPLSGSAKNTSPSSRSGNTGGINDLFGPADPSLAPSTPQGVCSENADCK